MVWFRVRVRWGDINKCDICSLAFQKKEDLTAHVQSVHRKIRVDVIPLPKSLSCELCEFTCILNIQLKKHKEKKHAMQKRCNNCDETMKLYDLIHEAKLDSDKAFKELASKLETTVNNLKEANDVKCKKLGNAMAKITHKLEVVETAVILGKLESKNKSRKKKKRKSPDC